ncbi:hypothetical protein ABBQ32_004351 [Trebouxia sp. C0010 RCD-2024]
MPDSQPAWMALSRGHRQHWSQRQQQQQAQQQQQPSEQPRQRHSNRATVGDTLDVLAPPDSHPQLSEWRNINLTHGYDERDLYVKQNRQHTMVPTKTQATKPVHFHSAKTAQSSDQLNTRCRGGKAQSNKHCQGKL